MMDEDYIDEGYMMPRSTRRAEWACPSSSRDRIHGDKTAGA